MMTTCVLLQKPECRMPENGIPPMENTTTLSKSSTLQNSKMYLASENLYRGLQVSEEESGMSVLSLLLTYCMSCVQRSLNVEVLGSPTCEVGGMTVILSLL